MEPAPFEKIMSSKNIFFTVKSVDQGYHISAVDDLTGHTYGPESIYEKINRKTVNQFLENAPEVKEVNESHLVIKVDQYDEPITLRIEKKDPNALLTLMKRRVEILEKENERLRTRVYTGQTKPSDWTTYTSEGIMVTVDISHLNLKTAPIIITSLGGKAIHWTLTGGSAVYVVPTKSFTVYIRYCQGGSITNKQAIENEWVLNYAIFNQD